MSEILLYKFTQNPILSDMLINTGDRNLHETTADMKWATGSGLSSQNTRNGTWNGGDCLGKLIEGVRESLISPSSDSSSCSSPPSPHNSQTGDTHDPLSPLPDDDNPADYDQSDLSLHPLDLSCLSTTHTAQQSNSNKQPNPQVNTSNSLKTTQPSLPQPPHIQTDQTKSPSPNPVDQAKATENIPIPQPPHTQTDQMKPPSPHSADQPKPSSPQHAGQAKSSPPQPKDQSTFSPPPQSTGNTSLTSNRSPPAPIDCNNQNQNKAVVQSPTKPIIPQSALYFAHAITQQPMSPKLMVPPAQMPGGPVTDARLIRRSSRTTNTPTY